MVGEFHENNNYISFAERDCGACHLTAGGKVSARRDRISVVCAIRRRQGWNGRYQLRLRDLGAVSSDGQRGRRFLHSESHVSRRTQPTATQAALTPRSASPASSCIVAR